MSATMTKRERVERTMAFQETDRVPLYDLLRNDDAFAHFSGEELPALSAEPKTVETLNRISGKAVGAFVDMTRSVGFGPVEDKETTDEYGFVRRHATFEKTTWIVTRPFDDEKGGIDFLKKRITGIRRETAKVTDDPRAYREAFHRTFLDTQARIGDTVNLLTQQGVGLDDIRHSLGVELFAYIQADHPDLVSEALEASTDRNIAICHAIADVSLSPAVLTYSDIAYKGRLMHSPDYLRREVFPRIKRINDAWHEHGFKCLFHSDGYLMEILDDLIEAGIDGLNPIETVAGMDLKEIREKYGKKLFLAGGIDMSQLLSNGSPEEVRVVCGKAIEDAYPGYFMGSTTEADNSCRLENLQVMHEVAMGSRRS
jgi:hypothetical protein